MIQSKIDTTIAEIHEIRREISERLDGDVFAIARDAARRQREFNRRIWCPNANKLDPAIQALESETF